MSGDSGRGRRVRSDLREAGQMPSSQEISAAISDMRDPGGGQGA